MKKLASLVTLLSIGLFAVGCTETTEGPEPIPGDAPVIEGGSGVGDTVIEEEPISEDVPPTTEEVPPTLTPEPETQPGEAGSLEESAEGTPSATEAAEAADEAEATSPE